MDENEQYKVEGLVSWNGQKHPAEQQEIGRALQEFMNEHDIYRIDLYLNPFQQGPPTMGNKGSDVVISKN